MAKLDTVYFTIIRPRFGHTARVMRVTSDNGRKVWGSRQDRRGDFSESTNARRLDTWGKFKSAAEAEKAIAGYDAIMAEHENPIREAERASSAAWSARDKALDAYLRSL